MSTRQIYIYLRLPGTIMWNSLLRQSVFSYRMRCRSILHYYTCMDSRDLLCETDNTRAIAKTYTSMKVRDIKNNQWLWTTGLVKGIYMKPVKVSELLKGEPRWNDFPGQTNTLQISTFVCFIRISLNSPPLFTHKLRHVKQPRCLL